MTWMSRTDHSKNGLTPLRKSKTIMFLDIRHRAKGHPCYSTALPTYQALFSVVSKRLSCSKWWSTRVRPPCYEKFQVRTVCRGAVGGLPSTKRRECSAIKFTTMLTKFSRYRSLFCHPKKSNGVVLLLAGEVGRAKSSRGDLRLLGVRRIEM